ncbi:MAG: phosphodiester glycosidase family protein, partial [Erythrobacter sp.]
MRAALIVLAAPLMLAACSEAPAGEPVVRSRLDGANPAESASPSPEPTAQVQSACRSVTFEDVPLTVCTADPARHRIDMANLGGDKQPFASLSAFAKSVDPATIAFAVNGGMYGDDLKPIGYYVQNGERLAELNRGDGDGNFYMKPNGVFFGSGGAWKVLGSNTFFDAVGDRPQFGTQSGPLLLIEGKLHPEVQDNGPSKAVRNAVGVDA